MDGFGISGASRFNFPLEGGCKYWLRSKLNIHGSSCSIITEFTFSKADKLKMNERIQTKQKKYQYQYCTLHRNEVFLGNELTGNIILSNR